MTTLQEGRVVVRYRRCRKCCQWKRMGNFSHGHFTCWLCARPTNTPGMHAHARGYVLTNAGQRLARQLLAEDVA